jgi:hypothetical protein
MIKYIDVDFSNPLLWGTVDEEESVLLEDLNSGETYFVETSRIVSKLLVEKKRRLISIVPSSRSEFYALLTAVGNRDEFIKNNPELFI